LDSNSDGLVPDTWSRQDIIKKRNLFRSVAVENMKTDYSVIFITTTYPTDLSWVRHIYTQLQTDMNCKATEFSAGKCLQ
jgi:hypothetical protein